MGHEIIGDIHGHANCNKKGAIADDYYERTIHAPLAPTERYTPRIAGLSDTLYHGILGRVILSEEAATEEAESRDARVRGHGNGRNAEKPQSAGRPLTLKSTK